MPTRNLTRRITQALTRKATEPGSGGGWSPLSLFASGEQGVWYDPSDFSTMFQDSAGTTPVTAVGQPVGKILDKSGRGNHASQSTAAARPVLQQDGNGKYYLAFDGVDDFLSTGSINFTATDKMTVVAGVRKLSDAATASFVELSAALPSNNGSFAIFLPPAAGNFNAVFSVRGTSNASANYNIGAAPVSVVFTGQADIATDFARVSINGINGTPTATDQGTGNFGNYPIYIGRRAGTSLPFNGRLYQLIVRGATTADLVRVETFVNSKTGAY